jgi:DNA modification methylase
VARVPSVGAILRLWIAVVLAAREGCGEVGRMTITIHTGDALEVLSTLPDQSAHCCVTSPPYWALRDYGEPGQIGLEPTPEEYVAKLVDVFREVRRVLRGDGTLWLNLGDSYASSPASGGEQSSKMTGGEHKRTPQRAFLRPPGLKPKDLVGIPWRVAFALQSDGWYLRSDIIWAKPNPMPESVTDRPTKSHEYIFLMAKSGRYWFDQEAVREKGNPEGSHTHGPAKSIIAERNDNDRMLLKTPDAGRNIRTVWTVATQPFAGAHFATFPPKLIEPCIKAGCPAGGTVLDPFGGAGTVGLVADRLGRNATLIELNPEYAEMARERIRGDAPLFVDVS